MQCIEDRDVVLGLEEPKKHHRGMSGVGRRHWWPRGKKDVF